MGRALIPTILSVALALMATFVSVEGDCSGKTSCKACVSNVQCYWCIQKVDGGKNTTCIKAWNPSFCSDFYSLTCDVDGVIWVSLAGAGAGLVTLLIVGCCIYCCCCHGKGRRRRQFEMREREDSHKRQDMKDRQEARRSDRKTKSDAIRKKYGLTRDEDDKDDAPFSSTGTTGRYQRFD